VRPADQAGANDDRVAAEALLDHALARGLERAVGQLDVLGVDGWKQGGGLVERPRQIGVGRDRRHEHVAPRVERHRLGHHARHEATRIDDHVPAPPGQRAHPAVAVAVNALDGREQIRLRQPAAEHGHPVAVRQRRLHHVPPEEHGAAQDKDRRHHANASPGSPLLTGTESTDTVSRWAC
jgi:hypothetical protein